MERAYRPAYSIPLHGKMERKPSYFNVKIYKCDPPIGISFYRVFEDPDPFFREIPDSGVNIFRLKGYVADLPSVFVLHDFKEISRENVRVVFSVFRQTQERAECRA